MSTAEAYMDEQNPPDTAEAVGGKASYSDHVDRSERERLVFALSQRFAPHVQAAAAAVRDAKQDLLAAGDELARARAAAANEPYQSDPLVFMRASVKDEVGALARKTTPKKIRTSSTTDPRQDLERHTPREVYRAALVALIA
jgi:hypothetical protein